jgi:6,7-dimethyl-8-ribityllumazine synthase
MADEIKDGQGARVGIAVSRFNEVVTDRLLRGAREALEELGVAEPRVVRVPGAFELPLACRWLAESGTVDAIVALGAVVRGGTPHFEHVCTQAARGILDTSLATGVPVGFGVLTCDTLEQALERAGGAAGNKGVDAARAALEMLGLHRELARDR